VNGSYVETIKPRKAHPGTVVAIGRVQTSEPIVVVPVELRQADGILGFDAQIGFDASVLRFKRAEAPKGDATVQAFGTAREGTLSLVAIGMGQAIEGTKTVANLVFERVDPANPNVYSAIVVGQASSDGQLDVEHGAFTSSPTALQHESWGGVKVLFR
jgi:hypothetical protein